MSISIISKVSKRFCTIDTEFGLFELEGHPVFENMIQVRKVSGTIVVVGFPVEDVEGYEDPLSQGRGNGLIYLKSLNHNMFQHELGLDENDSPNVEQFEGEAEQVAIQEACQSIVTQLRPGNVVRKIVPDDRYGISGFAYMRGPHSYRWKYQVSYARFTAHDIVIMASTSHPIPDTSPIAGKLWQDGRENGSVGNPWAITIALSYNDYRVDQPWNETNRYAYASSGVAGVWIPTQEAIDSLDVPMSWDIAKGWAKDDCDLFNDWANGNISGVVAQRFDLENDQWIRTVADSCWEVYGYDDLDVVIKELMDELIDDTYKEA